MALAVGLHHDPARARTHVFVQDVVHVPHARDPLHRFRVVRAGVFPFAEVLETREWAGKVDPRSGKEREEDFWKGHELVMGQQGLLAVAYVTNQSQIGTYRIDVGVYSLSSGFLRSWRRFSLTTVRKRMRTSKTCRKLRERWIGEA